MAKTNDIFELIFHEVPASDEPFDPKEVFVVGGTELPISLMGQGFLQLVAQAKVERGFKGSKLFSRILRRPAKSREIMEVLGGKKKDEISWRELAHCLQSADHNNSYLFFIDGCAVRVYWDEIGWYFRTFSIEVPHDWLAGHLVFSRVVF